MSNPMPDSNTAAEVRHDMEAKEIPARFVAEAIEEIVDQVICDGAYPRPRRGRLVRTKLWLADFTTLQDDCGELLAMAMLDNEDGILKARDIIAGRLRELLSDSTAAALVEERARELERESIDE